MGIKGLNPFIDQCHNKKKAKENTGSEVQCKKIKGRERELLCGVSLCSVVDTTRAELPVLWNSEDLIYTYMYSVVRKNIPIQLLKLLETG